LLYSVIVLMSFVTRVNASDATIATVSDE
jgi:hypothetical protein